MNEYLDSYYDTVRQLLAGSLTHVGLGTSGAPDATELTDAHIVPVSATVFPPDDVRKLWIRWVVPAGDANGLMIREIGLLRADGVMVARMVRATPIEKTADMEIGEWWKLDV